MKRKNILIFILTAIFLIIIVYSVPHYTKYHLPVKLNSTTIENNNELKKLQQKAKTILSYSKKHNYSTSVCFLIDMKLASGKRRFFIYDFKKDSIINAGLVAHGKCNTVFLNTAKFSNTPECGCSAAGKYKVGYKYSGRFGTAYKLTGMDSSNSNAFERNIVLHAYSCVPDEEIFPQSICNSLGCPMVSYKFLNVLSQQINTSSKPILLWIFE